MARYVDGFVLSVPKKKLERYGEIAKKAGKLWIKYGALEYWECAGDDTNVKMGVPFPRLAKAKAGETVIFSWIVYRSKAHRDRVMAKIMKDPWMNSMDQTQMPFDTKRMSYGGFKTIVMLD